MIKYETVIGLEVHIQLNTASKAFCSDSILFGEEANTQVSAVSLAHPGTLPVANKMHIEKAIKLGLALGCKINRINFFDRKHYFYPDLPKGYQITQDKEPICLGGSLRIAVAGKDREIRLHHIHMEEDAGKTIHDLDEEYSFVDLNRAGTPLLELVTEPDLRSGEEVLEFIAELQNLLRYIEVSDADMEKGSMRCDCNVSVRPIGHQELTERCEIKNLNSKKFARDAVEYEAKRQIALYEAGKTFSKQTLHYDPNTGQTQILREKEGADDYRYFPDPDLSPVMISDKQLEDINAGMPKLPWIVRQELIEHYGFSADYSAQLSQHPKIYKAFVELSTKHGDPGVTANIMVNQFLPFLNQQENIDSSLSLYLPRVSEFIDLILSGKISNSVATQMLWPLLLSDLEYKVEEIADREGFLLSEDQDFVSELIHASFRENPDQFQSYKKGKKALFGFFMGDVMKRAQGKADPKVLKQRLQELLSQS